MSNQPQKLRRRDFLRASVATLAGATLVACVPAAGPSATSDDGGGAPAAEATTIAYWTFWADRWGEFQQQIVDEYNETHDDIQVEMLIVPWGELPTKLLTAVSAGNPPDFSIIGRGEVVEWAVRGGVLPTGSPQPDPAYEFLAWMSIEGVAKWVPHAADMVSRTDQTDIYPNALPDNEEFHAYWQLYNDALAYAHHEPAMPARRFWNDQLEAAVDSIVRGQMGPEEALQTAQDVTQRELDKALGKA